MLRSKRSVGVVNIGLGFILFYFSLSFSYFPFILLSFIFISFIFNLGKICNVTLHMSVTHVTRVTLIIQSCNTKKDIKGSNII